MPPLSALSIPSSNPTPQKRSIGDKLAFQGNWMDSKVRSSQQFSLMSLCAISQEIRSAQEAEIQNREEVGMDLDDEVPNLGGLIEQPALQMAEEKRPEQEESLQPSKAKKPRCDAQAPGNSIRLPCSMQ